MNIVLEEADESLFWLEIIESSKIIECTQTSNLKKEAEEIVAIAVIMIKKTRYKMKNAL
jgi:four helix bundle protein